MKKGQLQIQETILSLIIFFAILVVAIIFFFQVQANSIEGIYDDFQEEKFLNLVIFVQDMPELKVSNELKTEQCIDYYKAIAFSGISEDYRSEFGNTEIVLELNNRQELLYSNRIEGGDVRIIRSPVCLYDERDDKHKIAELIVKQYTR